MKMLTVNEESSSQDIDYRPNYNQWTLVSNIV